jgi:hypothetical protein
MLKNYPLSGGFFNSANNKLLLIQVAPGPGICLRDYAGLIVKGIFFNLYGGFLIRTLLELTRVVDLS